MEYIYINISQKLQFAGLWTVCPCYIRYSRAQSLHFDSCLHTHFASIRSNRI